MNDKKLIQYYKNLLILQYKDKPSAVKHVEHLLSVSAIFELLTSVEQGYNLDAQLGKLAKGQQLDVLADYVGISRQVRELISPKSFGTINYNEHDSSNRITTYVTSSIQYGVLAQGQIWTYLSSLQYKLALLSDTQVLKMVQMKGFLNTSNLSLADIDYFFYTFFDNHIEVKQSALMELEYLSNPYEKKLLALARQQGAIPKPAGVRIHEHHPELSTFVFTKYGTTEVNNDELGLIPYGNKPRGKITRYEE